MSNNNNSSSGGIGFAGMLAIVFIVLKLTKYIDWSWWWVLCPLWAPIALAVAYSILKLIFPSKTHDNDLPNQRTYLGKSKWQERLEQMQEAKKLRENK